MTITFNLDTGLVEPIIFFNTKLCFQQLLNSTVLIISILITLKCQKYKSVQFHLPLSHPNLVLLLVVHCVEIIISLNHQKCSSYFHLANDWLKLKKNTLIFNVYFLDHFQYQLSSIMFSQNNFWRNYSHWKLIKN